jgi:hypothetical protein
MLPCSFGARLCGWRRNYMGAYIVEINKYAIFTKYHFLDACAATCAKVAVYAAPFLVLTLAPEQIEAMNDDVHTPVFIWINFAPLYMYCTNCGRARRCRLWKYQPMMKLCGPAVHDSSVSHTSDSYAPGTHPGTKWKFLQLLKFQCWPKWQVSECTMMDAMHADNMFVKPLKSSSSPADAVLLSTVWNYSIKMNGNFKART